MTWKFPRKFLPSRPERCEYIVYEHRHRRSGRAYIGFTCTVKCHAGQMWLYSAENAMMYRWKEHAAAARCVRKSSRSRGTYLSAMLRKYGAEAFDHEVLEAGLWTLEAALEAEQKWIERRGTLSPNGLNLARIVPSFTHHESSIEKLRASTTEVWRAMSAEERASRSNKARSALTPENEKALRKGAAALSVEQRIAIGKKAWASRSEESRRRFYTAAPAALAAARARRTPAENAAIEAKRHLWTKDRSLEFWSSLSKRNWAKKSKAERSEIARKREASLPEETKRRRNEKIAVAHRARFAKMTKSERAEFAANRIRVTKMRKK